ncbi:hypothetical protein GALL_134430 [mine drainage metagenome]|uniref:Uncharacterized protein n=1 Tax=mine drainage metagenome TaxID=410659 RepID=A0A1J5S9A4_9ZZZZ
MPIADIYTRKVTISRLEDGIFPIGKSIRAIHVGTVKDRAEKAMNLTEVNISIYETVRFICVEHVQDIPAANDNAELTSINIITLASLMAELAKELHLLVELIAQEQKNTRL